MKGPNPFSVGISVMRARLVAPPRPTVDSGAAAPEHSRLSPVLSRVEKEGVPALPGLRTHLEAYVADLSTTDPDRLNETDALAYWLNLYNAGALKLAGEAFTQNHESVLRMPGAFTSTLTSVAGTPLTLTQIEHGKIRRFGDPRIHGALVCGSVSCPTLRYEPFEGAQLDRQLDDQMTKFLSSGGARVSDSSLLLSRVFLWYGSDFVRPHRMPTLLPARKRMVARALQPWLEPDISNRLDRLRVGFQPYDWGLACSVS